MNSEIVKQFSKAFTQMPFNQLLGLKLNELGTEEIKMSFSMKKELVGNYMYGILHGGVISSVLDMAGGVVVMMAAIQKHADKDIQEIANIIGKSSTVNLNVDYIRPGRGEQFVATARLVQAGNKISFATMELLNDEQVLIARGSATYLVG